MTNEERQRQFDLLTIGPSSMYTRDVVREIGFYRALLAMPATDQNREETDTLHEIYRVVIKQSVHLLKTFANIPADCL